MKISSKNTIFSMVSTNKPVCNVSSGDVVIFETIDAFGKQIAKETDSLSAIDWNNINPATGPVHVEGALAGDILKVEIIDIKVADVGSMTSLPNEGAIGDRITKEKSWIMPIVDGKVEIYPGIFKTIEPMIGVIGTAPANGENIPTGTPGMHGGNMDNKKIAKGSTLYLPVEVDGALLAMGDLHALMADGEVLLCGIEIDGEVTVKIDVIKDEKMPLPVLVNEESVITIASALTLDQATVDATANMHDLIKSKTELDSEEIVKLLSLCGQLCICQIVDPLKTARMEFPKDVLCKIGFKMS